MMRIGLLIICRFSSRRLPGKILREIAGKPILEYIHERLSSVSDPEEIVVATSVDPTDDPIVQFCKIKGYKYFRGDLNNVAERFLKAGLANDFDYIARINGDNIFVDREILVNMLKIARSGKYDFISNVKKRTFPKGMSVEIVRTDFYLRQYEKFNNPGHFEHVMTYFYDHPESGDHYYLYNEKVPEAAGSDFAIDSNEDFDLASRIISSFKGNHINYGLREVYNIFSKLKDDQ